MNRLMIESDGEHTRVVIDGVDISNKVASIRFQHTGGDIPLCEISMFGFSDMQSMSTMRKCVSGERETCE